MNQLTLKKYDLENERFRIRYVNEKRYFEMKKTHFHNAFEIYYLLRGEKLFFVNNKLFSAGKGDMVIINPFDVHKTSSVENMEAERILLHFKQDFIEELSKQENFDLAKMKMIPTKVSFTIKEQIQIEMILKEILKECEEKQANCKLYIKSLLFMLLIRILRHNQNERMEKEYVGNPIEQKMLDIATYISSNYHDNLTLSKLSSEYYISQGYLSRTFKKVTGLNISEYIQLVRIRESQKLLQDTNDKIIEIAATVGFSQIAHFNKTFKKVTGTSPQRFRNTSKTI
ncbi:AraC family transcriptional regulator [Evansella sp. AB-rgal1]|uniref:AraC family transcriptional regulator n=1 Tax=Evansella sp. AB-rgal1 TaxID=3242696 RepID=UPI00359E01EB